MAGPRKDPTATKIVYPGTEFNLIYSVKEA
jgi:hypothetical protein